MSNKSSFEFPSKNEFAPYYHLYIDRLKTRSLNEILDEDTGGIKSLLTTLSEEQGLYRYAEGKWTTKEMILHCIDTERIFSARALMFSRGEKNDIRGYDHEAYVEESNANERTNESLLEEYLLARASTRALFQTFTSAQLLASGTANNNKVSVRSIACIIPGHFLHHISVLKEKYGFQF